MRQIIIRANQIKHVQNYNVAPKTTTNDKSSTLNELTNRLNQQKTYHRLKCEPHNSGHCLNLVPKTMEHKNNNSELSDKTSHTNNNENITLNVSNFTNNSMVRILKQTIEQPTNLLFNQIVPKFKRHSNDTYDSTTTTSHYDPYDVLLTSQSARHELAQYILNELLIKNFTDSLDTSPIRLNAAFKEAISNAVNEPNILIDNSSSSSTSSASSAHNNSSANEYINQNHTTSLNNSLLIVASSGATVGGSSGAHLGGHISGSPKPYFGDALYSFQNMYWPVHCIICLIICTLGIFANVTNIIVLTR